MCAVSAYFYLGTLAIAGRKERGLPYSNPCLRFTSSRIELSTEASLYRKRRNTCSKYSSLLPHYSKTGQCPVSSDPHPPMASFYYRVYRQWLTAALQSVHYPAVKLYLPFAYRTDIQKPRPAAQLLPSPSGRRKVHCNKPFSAVALFFGVNMQASSSII